MKRRVFLVFRFLFFTAAFGLATIWTLAYTLRDELKASFVSTLNEHLVAEVAVGDIALNFTGYFPRLAVEFSNVLIMDPLSPRDTLLWAQEVAFTFNPVGVIQRSVLIDHIALKDGMASLVLNARSEPNYRIWKPSESTASESEVSLELSHISLDNMELEYTDYALRNQFALGVDAVYIDFQPNADGWNMHSEGPIHWRALAISGTNYSLDEPMNHAISLQWSPEGWQIRECRLIRQGSFIVASGVYTEDGVYRLELKSDKLALERWLGDTMGLDEALRGYASVEGQIHNESGYPFAQLGFQVLSASYEPAQGAGSVQDISAKGSFEGNLEDVSSFILRVDAFSGSIEEQPFAGSIAIEDFNRPRVSAEFKGQIALPFFNQRIPTQSLHWEGGHVDATLALNHRFPGWSGLNASDFSKANMRGTVQVVSAQGSYAGKSIENVDAIIQFEGGDAELRSLTGSLGSSAVQISGQLTDIIPAFFIPDVTVGIDARLQTPSINLDEWLETVASQDEQESEVWVPSVNYRLAFQVGTFSMGAFQANDLTGVVEQRYPVLSARDVSMRSCSGTAHGNVAFKELAEGSYLLEVSGSFTQVDATQLFTSFENFGQSTLKAEHVRGKVSGTASYSGKFDRQLRPILPSIQATSSLHMTNVRLLEFEPLLAMAKYIERDELAQVDFDEWQGDLLIQDETVILPSTQISSSVMDFNITGAHQFDNSIDYHISFPVQTVLKPNKANRVPPELSEWYELAETDRPDLHLKITGTVDNPLVKYDFKQAKNAFIEDLKRQGRELKTIFREEFRPESRRDSQPNEASTGTPDFILDWNPDGDTLKNP